MRRIFREALPEAVGAIIATVFLSIVGILLKGVLDNILTVLLIVALFAWIISIYITSKRDKTKILLAPKVARRLESARRLPKGPYKYLRLRRWTGYAVVIIPLFILAGFFVFAIQNSFRAEKFIILVADFSGPESEKYQVTNTIVENLNQATVDTDEILIENVGKTFNDSISARKEGERRNANIVIWGWYGATGEVVPISVHFEVIGELEQVASFCPSAQGEVRLQTQAELESFSLQTNLSNEMRYLSLVTIGLAQYDNEEWATANSSFEEALKYAPADVRSWPVSNTYYRLGRTYVELEDYSDAIDAFNQVINDDPFASAYYFRAFAHKELAYRELEDWSATISDLTQVIDLQPDHFNAIKFRGDAYFLSGEYEATLADYDLVLQLLGEDNSCTLLDRGYAYLEKGDLFHAIADFNQNLDLNSNQPEPLFGLGRAYFEKGEYQEALDYLTRAIMLAEGEGIGFPVAHLYRGYTQEALGNKEQAIADFKMVLSLLESDNHIVYPEVGYKEKLSYRAKEALQLLGG